jgi:hypothetical protein
MFSNSCTMKIILHDYSNYTYSIIDVNVFYRFD